MKNKILSVLLNALFITVVIAIGIFISTIGLAKKIDSYNNNIQTGIEAIVEKDDVPIIALTRGIIKNLYVREGQRVKKGEALAEITNPILEEQIKTLQKYPDNVSARTQVAIAEAELSYTELVSPVEGIIGSVDITIDSPVDEYSKIMDIFSDGNTKLLTHLTIEQYSVAEKMNVIPVYSPRLDQVFYAKPDTVKPNQINPDQSKEDAYKIAFYLTLSDPNEASSLINGETLEVRLEPEPTSNIRKPTDIFLDFWSKFR